MTTTEYKIKNNKTNEVIGTAKITRGGLEDDYLTVTIDGNERSIKVSSKQTPEQAFNSWINNSKTPTKYKK